MVNTKIYLSIVLGSYNRKSFLKTTIASIRESKTYVAYEIIVIDGGSDDGSLTWLLKQKDIITIIQHNRGIFKGRNIERKSWGYFMNLGFKISKGKYILMISDDCLLQEDAITNGIKYSDELLNSGRKIGAVAFYWRNWPKQINYWVGQSFGKFFVNHGLYLKDALEEVNWIDEDNYHFYHADSDVCLKMWEKGYEVVVSPNSYVEHFIHANKKVRESNLINQQEDWENFQKKWGNYEIESQIKYPDWIYKEYNDKNNLALNFPYLERLKILTSEKKDSIKIKTKKKLKKFSLTINILKLLKK